MRDAHVHFMQVKLCKANTRGVTNLSSFCLETVLASVQARCMVCARCTIGSQIVLDAPDGTPR